ncbi:MAG: amino acid ABC transporter substrate-binding protein [Acetobacteraceae bacterium]|nr:amino acid ABC transporter substrate-binding protein [Acetobacteraceae bacterium]
MARIARRTLFRLAGGTALAMPALHTGHAQARKLVFGGSVPLSGGAAETGLNVNNGYATAVKFINEQGGVDIAGTRYQLELKLFDDASDPSRATTLIQRLIDDRVDFFLGSFGSNIVLPTAAITERAEKPMVQAGGGSDQIFTQGYRYVFGMYPRATRQFQSTVAFFKSLTPQPKTFSVIATNDAFSKTFAAGIVKDCTAGGFQLIENYLLPEQISDTSSVLSSVRSKTPDMLLCAMHDQNSLLVARQMIATGTNVGLLFQGLGPQLTSYREALGRYANGIFYPTYWDRRSTWKDPFFGSPTKFAEYYAKNFTRPLAYHCAAGAACIITYVKAMQAARSIDPVKVRDALAATDLETLYGRIKFTPEGDGDAVVMGPSVGQVLKGQGEVVYPAGAKTADLLWPVPDWDKKS